MCPYHGDEGEVMSGSRTLTRRGTIVLIVAMLAAMLALIAPPAAAINGDAPVAYTLTILHNNDGESQVIGTGPGDAYGGAARFKTVVDDLRASATTDGVVMLSSGDNFLAGPEFQAGLVNGVPFYDTIAMALIGYDAVNLGNHDFDFGPDVLADFIDGYAVYGATTPPYVAANLDFSGEPRLQAYVDSGILRPSVVLDVGGQQIGVIGADTPRLPTISSPRNVVVDIDVAGVIQAEIDALTTAGVDKIILTTHLQSIDEEIALGTQLSGADVIIAGGGDELLANPGDLLIPGDTPFAPYPMMTVGDDGNEIPVVTTSGEYKYVGRLVVGFDAAGNVVEIDTGSGPVRVSGVAPDAVVPDPQVQTDVVDPVVAALAGQAANVIGTSEVALDGRRNSVRRVEANEGNLIADAHLWQARQVAAAYGVDSPQIALQNGGGIRNDSIVPPGDITELDTFDMVPFPNFLVVVEDVPAAQIKEILENAYSRVEFGDGRFAQIAGMEVVYDPTGTPRIALNDGTVTQEGDRIWSVMLDDGTVLVEDGMVVPGAPSVDVATIDFLANGGDQYPFGGLPYTGIGFTYQQGLYNYITDGLGGLITAADYPEGGEGRIVAEIQPITIPEIQGDGQFSAYDGMLVRTMGVVTAVAANGRDMWIQDVWGDGDPATSDGIQVDDVQTLGVLPAVGDMVDVTATVDELQFGNSLPVTMLNNPVPAAFSIISSGNPLPEPVMLTDLPNEVMAEGIAFWEALEGMRVSAEKGEVVAATNGFGEFGFVTKADAKKGSGYQKKTGVILLRPLIADDVDYNPERIMVDDITVDEAIVVQVGDEVKHLTGVVDYTFSMYKLQPTEWEVKTDKPPKPGKAVSKRSGGGEGKKDVSITTYNVENLFDLLDDPIKEDEGSTPDPEDLKVKLAKLARAIEDELELPEILVVQEIENTSILQLLGDMVNAATGTHYMAVSFETSDVRGIEVGFLWDTDRVSLLDAFQMSGPDVEAAFGPASPSPGREPLVGLFDIDGTEVWIIGNHFKSKSGDDPLYGVNWPPIRITETQRHAQAMAVRSFVDDLFAADPMANVIVTGDMNDFEFGEPGEGPTHTVGILEGGPGRVPLYNVIWEEKDEERWSFVFDGNSQVLDHMLVSPSLLPRLKAADFLHFNTPYPDVLSEDPTTAIRSSDHDALEGRFDFHKKDKKPKKVKAF
jgi:2',3'-cyclic-nucleotide 2'-phosphodiesterase (5'-nucleotidase family)/predicted extracellular nuclease